MANKFRVLLVDDDLVHSTIIRHQITGDDLELTASADGDEAFALVQKADFDVILLDVMMPGLSGLDFLRQVKELDDAPEVIMLTADNSLSTGVDAMRLGAYDYLTKPAETRKLEQVIRKAAEKRRLVRQHASLRAVVRRPGAGAAVPLVYRSAALGAVVAQAEAAARLDTTVLIAGESGVGKDVLARWIHARSPRADAPIITVNCGALPEALFESEFFGHEKGAFTGAAARTRGLVEAADGSTLFLDEIGEMPLPMQVKLLHFLENGRFRRVGSTRDHVADVRVIAATNRSLRAEVGGGRFRQDLYYRLNVVSFEVPPLRARREDVGLLIDYYLDYYLQRFNLPSLTLTAEARCQLENYSWPGNVRELRNCLERAIALARDNVITPAQVVVEPSAPRSPQAAQASPAGAPPFAAAGAHPTLAELERQHIERVLADVGGNRERAAAVLGISARTLYRKLREYGESEPGDSAAHTSVA
jgi:DNA-binding NtrC family response regulator